MLLLMYLMCQVEIYFYGINSFTKENMNLIAQNIIGKLLPNIVNARFDTFTVFFHSNVFKDKHLTCPVKRSKTKLVVCFLDKGKSFDVVDFKESIF